MKSLILALCLLLSHFTHALTVNIQQTGTTANSCTRTLTADVTGGSGNYSYTWSIVSPIQSWPGTNGVATVYLALNESADVNVSVHDLNSNSIASTTITVNRILSGSFDIFIPNLFTPNGDSYNDYWIVTDADKAYSPINAYSYSLSIKNSSNVVVFTASHTVTSGHLGIIGGDISWNGLLNGSGSLVPTGTYTYQLTLTNCSQSTVYNGQLSVLY